MKKEMKKVLSAVCSGCLAVCLWGCAVPPQMQNEKERELPELVMVYPGVAEEAASLQEKITEITEKKLGVRVRLEMPDRENYTAAAQRKLSALEQVDVMYMEEPLFLENYIQNRLLELSGLLEVYGQGIVEQIGTEYMDVCRFGGREGALYGLPTNWDYAGGWDTYILSREILDRYRIDETKIHNYEDLEKIFAGLHAQDPALCIVQSGFETFRNNQQIVRDALLSPVVAVKGEDGQITCSVLIRPGVIVPIWRWRKYTVGTPRFWKTGWFPVRKESRGCKRNWKRQELIF